MGRLDDVVGVYPYADTREMLEIIGNSVSEISEYLGQVKENADKVRGMLGDYGRLEAAAVVWSEHTVERIRISQELIENARPGLEANWSGDAYLAYKEYERIVLGRIEDTGEQARKVAAELRKVRDVVAEQYMAATTSLANIAGGVIGLAGGLGFLKSNAADKFTDFVVRFIAEVGDYFGQVIDSLGAGQQLVSGVGEVVAALKVPAPAEVAAPEIADPQRWDLRPGAQGGPAAQHSVPRFGP